MNRSVISWTNVTWNPTFGCSKVSDGCRNCYAERIALRFGHSKKPWTALNAKENVVLKHHKLNEPYKLKTPSLIFVNSMSDLFHDLMPSAYRAKVFAVMNDLPQHTFQILTKRPENAARWGGPWTPNIWMGTSVEDAGVLHRIEILRNCPAHIRFISFEPLIGPIDGVDLTGYSWVIVGGESGPRFRPMSHAWARRLLKECQEQRVAFFFKQSSAHRNEMGTSLQDTHGRFWHWNQYPGDLREPMQGQSHKFTYDSEMEVQR